MLKINYGMQCHLKSDLETMVSHLLKSTSDSFIRRLHKVQLSPNTRLIVRTNEKIPIAKFFYCHCSLCPDYRVNTTNYITNHMCKQVMLLLSRRSTD